MKLSGKEKDLLPDEFNLVGVVRIVDKPHPFKYKASFCNKGKAKVIQFKAVR